MTSRREFLERAAQTVVVAALPIPAATRPGGLSGAPRGGFLDVLRPPDRVLVQTGAGEELLVPERADQWTGQSGIVVVTDPRPGSLRLTLASPTLAIRRVRLRWHGQVGGTPLIVGDAWERGYGDLEWRGWDPDRVMPWYFATSDGRRTNAYGVRTHPAAFCHWQVDPRGVTLWADVQSGGVGVSLGPRVLVVCDVVSRAGHATESSFTALHAFCRQMCSTPRLPSHPVYGSNDWYSTYGDNSAATVRDDVAHIVELSPAGANRPFAVIDDGWQPGGGKNKPGAGLWDRGNEKFPDMPGLAAEMRHGGAQPGIWTRPLQAAADSPATWRLSRDHGVLDPSVPDVLHKVAEDIARLRQWGFALIKHDYSSWDIFGRWGFQMGAALTREGWSFAGGSARTTAEVIDDLYRTIRTAARDSLLIGCNTVSHLSAGHFEICRIGDDTSGTDWVRTRKMGVNSVAFRGVQQGAFYVADPDCVGVTRAVPWSLNRQWLDLVARSGTMLSVSLAPAALGAGERRDLKAALAHAAVPQPLAEPLDWQHSVDPERWRLMGRTRAFDWVGSGGSAD